MRNQGHRYSSDLYMILNNRETINEFAIIKNTAMRIPVSFFISHSLLFLLIL